MLQNSFGTSSTQRKPRRESLPNAESSSRKRFVSGLQSFEGITSSQMSIRTYLLTRSVLLYLSTQAIFGTAGRRDDIQLTVFAETLAMDFESRISK